MNYEQRYTQARIDLLEDIKAELRHAKISYIQESFNSAITIDKHIRIDVWREYLLRGDQGQVKDLKQRCYIELRGGYLHGIKRNSRYTYGQKGFRFDLMLERIKRAITYCKKRDVELAEREQKHNQLDLELKKELGDVKLDRFVRISHPTPDTYTIDVRFMRVDKATMLDFVKRLDGWEAKDAD